MTCPFAALQHAGREASDQPQRRVVVQRHRAFDVVPAVQRLGERAADRAAGVVDQDVDAAEAVLNRLHQLVDCVEIGQVAWQRDRGAALSADPLSHLVEQVLATCDDDGCGALACEEMSGRFADA